LYVLTKAESVELVYFNARKDYLQEILPINEKRIISGKVDIFNGRVQVMHPDHVVKEEDKALILTLEPVYPLTQGLTGKVLRRCIHDALKTYSKLTRVVRPQPS
jgi:ATP-dependent DNA helicase RecG